MTGAEHYQEAERLLLRTSESYNGAAAAGGGKILDAAFEVGAAAVAAAQVHATLALAAAAAHNTETGFAKIGEYGDAMSARL